MDWYYASNGQQAGPVSQEQLAELFRNGTVKPFDLVWNETMTEWTPIGKVAEFASVAGTTQSAPPLSSPPLSAPASSDLPPSLSAEPAPTLSAAAPGHSASPAPNPSGLPQPPNYLWQSIVVTVLCCIPLGIPAIIFSTKVKPAYEAGDYQAALDASKKTKMWCLIALIAGFIANVIIIGAQVAFALSTGNM